MVQKLRNNLRTFGQLQRQHFRAFRLDRRAFDRIVNDEYESFEAKLQFLRKRSEIFRLGAPIQPPRGKMLPAQREVAALAEQHQQRKEAADLYVEAYRRYCWTVRSLADLKLAPFHLVASEGTVHTAKDHLWHMETLARICRADPSLLLATPFQVVDLTDRADQDKGIKWWEELTASGGEGMVVKPLEFVAKGRKGMVQPAVKVRGREYLRIIYGPEYTLPENLLRLKSRGLGAKRSLALREFALGLEAVERFVHEEPLRRVHECVFGVLALESEPVDPRL